MSSSSTTKIISQPNDVSKNNKIVILLTVVFSLLSLSSLILNILVFFDIINNEESDINDYCPGDGCDINANNFKGAILKTNELKNVSDLTINADFNNNIISSTNMSIIQGTFSVIKNQNINFKEGFIVESGNTIFSNKNKQNVTKFISPIVSVTNLSITNITLSNIKSNIVNFSTISSTKDELINVIYTNMISSNIKSSKKLICNNLKCFNMTYTENNPTITNLTLSNLKTLNITIKESQKTNITNLFTKEANVAVISMDKSLTTTASYNSITGNVVSGTIGSTFNLTNVTTTESQGVDNTTFLSKSQASSSKSTIKNITSTQISFSNGIFNNLTCTNLTVTQNLNGRIIEFPNDVRTTTVSCTNYLNFKNTNSEIKSNEIIYDNISINKNLYNSLRRYSSESLNTNGKINLSGIYIDLFENKININTYRYYNNIFIDGDYPNTNDININISFTNFNNKTVFNGTNLVGTSFVITVNKTIENPEKNDVYLKYNNLFPVPIVFYGVGNPITINSGKTSKFLIKSQKNMISSYDNTCLEFINNSLTYFISVK